MQESTLKDFIYNIAKKNTIKDSNLHNLHRINS